jgi:Bacteriophage HK97-gp10, putative tail-component
MTNTVKFVPRFEAIKELAAEAAMADTLDDAAKKIERTAKDIAPVGETGNYRNSIKAQSSRIDEHGHQVAGVASDVEYAAKIEYGGLNRPAEHVLARAAEQNGLRIGKKRPR